MTDKMIEIRGTMYSDWFCLKYSRRSKNNLQFYLDQFNINDYWIYKTTDKQVEVTIEDLYEFKYSGYTFYRKDKYNKNDINKWIKVFLTFGGINYMTKELPPISLMKKIRIIK